MRPRPASTCPAYPRLYCLGLIEAAWTPGTVAIRRTRIRGFIASASLKLCAFAFSTGRGTGIRGFIASASLKHSGFRRGFRRGFRIRGFIASASLKLCIQCGRRRYRHRIRGFIASASLKLQSNGLGRETVRHRIRGFIASASLKLFRRGAGAQTTRRYPRLYCLGLIEAPIIAASKLNLKRYPRLYCLGLIEALFRRAHVANPRICIRGFIASASLKLKPRELGALMGVVSEALLPRPH